MQIHNNNKSNTNTEVNIFKQFSWSVTLLYTWFPGPAICWFPCLSSTIPFVSMFVNAPTFLNLRKTLNVRKASVFITSISRNHLIKLAISHFQAFILALCKGCKMEKRHYWPRMTTTVLAIYWAFPRDHQYSRRLYTYPVQFLALKIDPLHPIVLGNRHSGLMDCRSNGPGLSPGRGYCVVFL